MPLEKNWEIQSLLYWLCSQKHKPHFLNFCIYFFALKLVWHGLLTLRVVSPCDSWQGQLSPWRSEVAQWEGHLRTPLQKFAPAANCALQQPCPDLLCLPLGLFQQWLLSFFSPLTPLLSPADSSPPRSVRRFALRAGLSGRGPLRGSCCLPADRSSASRAMGHLWISSFVVRILMSCALLTALRCSLFFFQEFWVLWPSVFNHFICNRGPRCELALSRFRGLDSQNWRT